MKKLFFVSFLFLTSLAFSQTNVVSVTEQEPIVLNFEKNDSGEIIVKVKGHTQQIKIQINGAEILNLQKEDTVGNLTQAGFDSAILAIDTKSGSTGSTIDAQAPVILPVSPSVSPTPPLSTPY